MKYLIVLLLLLSACQGNVIEYETTSTCQMNDNSNFSHWCEVPCTTDLPTLIELQHQCQMEASEK